MADPTTTPEQSSTGTESPTTPLPPSEPFLPTASRDDLLLAYDRLDRDYRAVLETVGKVREYIADPGNWSAYDNRRRLLLDWLESE